MRKSKISQHYKRYRGKIKTIIVIDFNSIEEHIKWINNNRVSKHDFRLFPVKLIILDFTLCLHLKPYHVAALACLIFEYQSQGFKVRIKNASDELIKYLNSFYFDKFCNNEKFDEYKCSDPKTFPLWRLEKSKISIYPDLIKKYYENNHFDGKSLFSLSIALGELMNNVFDHSDSKIPGYTFTQYNSKMNSIITCVCDFGVGIPNKINKYLKDKNEERMENIDALAKAFEFSFSTYSIPHNRGFGLDNVLSNINELNSKMIVISNNALIIFHPDKIAKKITLDNHFPGTICVVTLDTNNLPVIEEELTDEILLL
ncbi:MAG: hypothetical protein PHO94_00015 [Petrimonas sp.]|nr:hypothetical protein [Petrimonas sp.]